MRHFSIGKLSHSATSSCMAEVKSGTADLIGQSMHSSDGSIIGTIFYFEVHFTHKQGEAESLSNPNRQVTVGLIRSHRGIQH